MGLGRNGLPAARALMAMGAEVVAWDDKPEARAEANDLMLRDLRGEDFAFDALVLSPGIPHMPPKAHPVAERARAWGVPILVGCGTAVPRGAAGGSRARFVGITGTNGKSTTTALTAHILTTAGRAAVAGGNLGTAALALELLPDDGCYVLEMSSYMLERLATLRFDAAAMLNLSPDHLDRHGDMVGYIAAKHAVFDRQTAGDLAVVGVDDADSRALAERLRAKPARVVTVSGEGTADVWCDHGMLRDAEGVILPMAEAPSLPGSHNAQNAAAAFGDHTTRLAWREPTSRAGCVVSLRCRIGRSMSRRSMGSRSSMTARRPTPMRRRARLAATTSWCGSLGGLAKAGGIEPLVPFFPRVALPC